MSKEFNYAVFSDCHVNNRRNPIGETLGQLTAAIMDNPESKNWDLIILPGDFFDTAMTFTNNDVYVLLRWVSKFLEYCHKEKIAVRVLRGTPSHDWNQSEVFPIMARHYPELNFGYYSKLDVEYIKEFDIHVLYLPDEWNVDPEVTWREITQLMKERKLTKVDYAFTHGFFDFQVPVHLNFTNHSRKRFESIVRYMIYNGHDHTFKTRGKVVVPGSFNRNRQGEEEAKGYITGEHHPGRADTRRFVENKLAHVYLTVDCKKLSTEEALAKIYSVIIKLKDGSNVRIEANSSDVISNSIDTLKKEYPTINFDTKIISTMEVNNVIVDVKEVKVNLVELRPDNVIEIMSQRLDSKVTEAVKQRALEYLKEA